MFSFKYPSALQFTILILASFITVAFEMLPHRATFRNTKFCYFAV